MAVGVSRPSFRARVGDGTVSLADRGKRSDTYS